MQSKYHSLLTSHLRLIIQDRGSRMNRCHMDHELLDLAEALRFISQEVLKNRARREKCCLKTSVNKRVCWGNFINYVTWTKVAAVSMIPTITWTSNL